MNTVLVRARGGFGRRWRRPCSGGVDGAALQRGTDMAAAARGGDVIVNGLNPPNYHDWDAADPRDHRPGPRGGLASGATVLVPGNVYVYGDQPGPWGPDTPHRPVARKGRIRAEMEARIAPRLTRACACIILRGGDFIDPPRRAVSGT